MGMVFCRGCAKQIHETAVTCPGCGASQSGAKHLAQTTATGSPWMAIVSLVLGIISALALFDDSEWDRNTVLGLGMFSGTGLVLGVISVSKKYAGQNMAIAGVVLSAVATLIFISLSVG